MSKSESIVFSGKDEDFLYFAEQFEARIFHLELNKIINRELDEKDFAPLVRIDATVEQRVATLRKGREILEEKELHVWYELVQCLVKNLFCFQDPIKAREVRLGKFCAKGSKAPRDLDCSN